MSEGVKNSGPSPEPGTRTPGAGFLHTFGRPLALVIVFCFFAVLVPDWNFTKGSNIENLLVQSAVVAACSLGATMVIITAGIDLSAGSVIALAVVVIASVLDAGGAPIVAVLAGVGAATVLGVVNGLLITGLRIVPFIVTLGGLQLYRGVAKGVANEQNIYPDDTWINSLMDPVQRPESLWDWWWKPWMWFPPGVWLTIIAAVFAALVLRYTRFGRHVFAIGSNEQTARLCGVRVNRTKILVYTLAGFFAGLAGLLQYSYLGIGQPTTAVGYELFVIASVVIGGGSLMGGEGTIFGTIIGALIIGVLASGGVQMGWPKWVQEIVTGGIIITAVTIDQWRHRRAT